jgi:hypothetical protein
MTNTFSPDVIQYIETNLFEGDHVCNFYEEVVIDSIPVHMTLKHIEINGYIRLILHNKNINKKLFETTDDEDDEYLYNLLSDCNFIQLCSHIPKNERCSLILTALNQIINNIRFCKYTGKFIHKNNINYSKVHLELPKIFKDNTNIKFNTNESNTCAICYEPTMCMTACNHTVCITCSIQIKPDIDEDVLCPICRDILLFV